MRLPAGLSHNFASESEFSSASSNFKVSTRLHKYRKMHEMVTLHESSHFQMLIHNLTPHLYPICPTICCKQLINDDRQKEVSNQSYLLGEYQPRLTPSTAYTLTLQNVKLSNFFIFFQNHQIRRDQPQLGPKVQFHFSISVYLSLAL